MSRDDLDTESLQFDPDEAPVLKKCAEGNDKNGHPIDVYKCPFCQRFLRISAHVDHPDCCPWGCER